MISAALKKKFHFFIGAVFFGCLGIALRKSNEGRKNSHSSAQNCES